MIGLATSLQRSIRSAERIQLVEGYVEIFAPSESNGGVIRISGVMAQLGPLQHPALRQAAIEFHAEASRLNELTFTFQDSSSRIAGYQLQDSSGNRIATRGNTLRLDGTSGTVRVQLLAPLPDDAQLVIFVATPESIEAVPFRMEDIPLP